MITTTQTRHEATKHRIAKRPSISLGQVLRNKRKH